MTCPTTTTAGDRGTHGLLEKSESDFSKNLAECAASSGRSCSAHATAGESDGTIGFSRLSELEFPSLNSSGCVAAVACARLPAVLGWLLLLPHLPFLLRLLLLLHMRAPHPCMMHTIRGRTRVGFRVPREGGAPKGGFPVRPKICVLSQRWRQW